MRAIPIGIGAGLLVGAAAGVGLERMTRHDNRDEVAAHERWSAGFDAEFDDEKRIDEHRNVEISRRIDAFTSKDPVPEGSSFERTGGEWESKPPAPPSRDGYNMFLTLGGIFGGMASILPLVAMSETRAADTYKYVGAKGAAAWAAPAFVAGLIGAAVLSDAMN